MKRPIDELKETLDGLPDKILTQLKPSLQEQTDKVIGSVQEVLTQSSTRLLEELKQSPAPPPPKEEKKEPEKFITPEEAFRMALDDIIEKGEASPYFELWEKRRELILKKGGKDAGGEGERTKTEEPKKESPKPTTSFRKSWC